METWISMLGESICFEFNTFSLEIMNYASNSILFRSKSWNLLRIQDFLFEIMNLLRIQPMQFSQKWTKKKCFWKKSIKKWTSGALRPASGSKAIWSIRFKSLEPLKHSYFDENGPEKIDFSKISKNIFRILLYT